MYTNLPSGLLTNSVSQTYFSTATCASDIMHSSNDQIYPEHIVRLDSLIDTVTDNRSLNKMT
jgi:hypothetical protein